MRTNAVAATILVSSLIPSLMPPPAEGAELVRVASTGHAVYYARRARDVDVRRSEAFLARLDSLFGPPPAGWRMQFYRHASLAEVQERIGFPAWGVTDLVTGRVDSVRPYHPHELVHAAMGRIGQPPVFFAEGLAVALTSGGSWNGREMDAVAREFLAARGELRDVVFVFALTDPQRDYALAGSFVGFLLDRYGIEPMLAFVQGCQEPGGCARALPTAYGRPFPALEVEWARALAEPRAPRPWYDAATWPASLRGRAPLTHRQEPEGVPAASPGLLAERASAPDHHLPDDGRP
ncbi:MAG TPA: hypothetical protein VMX54_05955 [Vicinamibacteria bacterium]|nr:hypothetical protein [Vicinamibacteria bacterium]